MEAPILPTIAEILASQDIISRTDASNVIVKVNEHMVAKYGRQVPLLEAQNLSYLHSQNLPVPRVFGTLTEPDTGRNFIVMELVPGQTLESMMDSLTGNERVRICQQLKSILLQLRGIPAPDYIGSLERQPCFDGVFYTGREVDHTISGPFSTEEEMNQGMLKNIGQSLPAGYAQLLSDLTDATMLNHKICFTHADFQPKNIMVQRIHNGDSGSDDLMIKIIDWEFSGWYPDYWEFCNATYAARTRPTWLEMMRSILPTPMQEYMLMELIRSVLFY